MYRRLYRNQPIHDKVVAASGVGSNQESRNNSKSLPDLTDEESSTKLLQELRQEIKSATLLRSANNAASAAKSFSSRFVSQVKAETASSGARLYIY